MVHMCLLVVLHKVASVGITYSIKYLYNLIIHWGTHVQPKHFALAFRIDKSYLVGTYAISFSICLQKARVIQFYTISNNKGTYLHSTYWSLSNVTILRLVFISILQYSLNYYKVLTQLL